MAWIYRPFALQVGDQRKQQREAEQKPPNGVGEPVPSEVDDAVADKEDHQDQDGAEPRAIAAKELPALRQVEHQPVRDRRANQVPARVRPTADLVTELRQEVRESLTLRF